MPQSAPNAYRFMPVLLSCVRVGLAVVLVAEQPAAGRVVAGPVVVCLEPVVWGGASGVFAAAVGAVDERFAESCLGGPVPAR